MNKILSRTGVFYAKSENNKSSSPSKQETPNCLSLASFESYPQKN